MLTEQASEHPRNSGGIQDGKVPVVLENQVRIGTYIFNIWKYSLTTI